MRARRREGLHTRRQPRSPPPGLRCATALPHAKEGRGEDEDEGREGVHDARRVRGVDPEGDERRHCRREPRREEHDGTGAVRERPLVRESLGPRQVARRVGREARKRRAGEDDAQSATATATHKTAYLREESSRTDLSLSRHGAPSYARLLRSPGRGRTASVSSARAHRGSRDALLRRRLAAVDLLQGDHGRRSRRLGRDHRLARLAPRSRGGRQGPRAARRRPRSEARRGDLLGSLPRDPAESRARSSRRRSRGSRTRSSISRQRLGHPRVRALRRPDAGCDPVVLVALRHDACARLRGDGDAEARVVRGRRRARA